MMVNVMNLEPMSAIYLSEGIRYRRSGGEQNVKLTEGASNQQDSVKISKDAQASFKKYIMPEAINHTNFEHSKAFEKLAGLYGKTPIITMPIIL
ncbi:MAG: hypothetical protein JXR73_19580 [Candidatus Omnitrophica bacterium]|nr:hypothetical protein [Candidatus Omnitrophota bacterium]